MKKVSKPKPEQRKVVPKPATATPSEAQRLAATILEVLAGVRSPPEAAQGLTISLPRYYQLEARGLAGLVAALAPRPQGKQPSLEKRILSLEKQLAAAHRQCARQEALVRATQRTLGLVMASKPKSQTSERDRGGRLKRKPTVRALRAARTLREQAVSSEENAGQVDPNAVQPLALDLGAEEVRPCST